MSNVATIIAAVAQEFGVTELDMRSARRAATVVRARHVAMYLARHMTLRSFPEIARLLGDRDHTSVMYGVKAADLAMDRDLELAIRVARLRDRIEQEAAQCA